MVGLRPIPIFAVPSMASKNSASGAALSFPPHFDTNETNDKSLEAVRQSEATSCGFCASAPVWATLCGIGSVITGVGCSA
jgi:hypothetical protein